MSAAGGVGEEAVVTQFMIFMIGGGYDLFRDFSYSVSQSVSQSVSLTDSFSQSVSQSIKFLGDIIICK